MNSTASHTNATRLARRRRLVAATLLAAALAAGTASGLPAVAGAAPPATPSPHAGPAPGPAPTHRPPSNPQPVMCTATDPDGTIVFATPGESRDIPGDPFHSYICGADGQWHRAQS